MEMEMEPQPRIPGKVYIIGVGDYRELFLVDLNSEGTGDDELQLKPMLKFYGFSGHSFCVLGSILYVVSRDYGKDESKNIYSFEIQAGDSDRIVHKHMLKKVCKMDSVKDFPDLIPTPDGKKIVVLSMIPMHYGFVDQQICHVELFDPLKEECEKLPDIVPNLNSPIRVAAFIGKSILHLETDRGFYTIDLALDPKERSWESFSTRWGVPYMRRQFIVIENTICLTSDRAYDLDVTGLGPEDSRTVLERWCYSYPNKSSPNYESVCGHPGDIILLEDVNPKACKFCTLLFGIEEIKDSIEYDDGRKLSIYVPHLILDVFKFDATQCKEDFARVRERHENEDSKPRTVYSLPTAAKIKSFRFRLESRIDDLYGLSLFSYDHAELPKSGRKRSLPD